MKMLMCRSCGKFVQALKDDETWTPLSDECPACGGREFVHTDSDTVLRTGE